MFEPVRICRGMAARWQHVELGVFPFALLISAALVLFYNFAFWGEVVRIRSELSLSNVLFLLSFSLLLVAFFNLFLSLAAFRFVLKPLAVALLVTGALVAYFMNSYGVMIDQPMIQNVFETDATEAGDLLNVRLFLYLLFLGVIPSVLVLAIRVRYRSLPGQLKLSIGGAALSLAVMVAVLLGFYQDYASLFRNERHLRYMLSPTNYIHATWKYAKERFDGGQRTLAQIGTDAARGPLWQGNKPVLFVLVVGETARAANFSLNGYGRPTNPKLAEEALINFRHVSSCGTATATSVPCMFSRLGRDEYDDKKARSQEGLLDVLSHAGVPVLWRENNSGCKGVCDRVQVQTRKAFGNAEDCENDNCFDQAMLHGLDRLLTRNPGDRVIVLHQNGSHGPAYHQRYPKQFELFTPVCTTSELQACDQQSIINAYDNTILYTDYFLEQVIELLKRNSERYDTAMIYVSDHGESLGEHNLYLHGLPYFIAPDEQKHVPMDVWLSDSFRERLGLDGACLSRESDAAFSHDNLFHSVLGLLDVSTSVYERRLDIFAPCRITPGVRPTRANVSTTGGVSG